MSLCLREHSYFFPFLYHPWHWTEVWEWELWMLTDIELHCGLLPQAYRDTQSHCSAPSPLWKTPEPQHHGLENVDAKRWAAGLSGFWGVKGEEAPISHERHSGGDYYGMDADLKYVHWFFGTSLSTDAVQFTSSWLTLVTCWLQIVTQVTLGVLEASS